MTTNRGFTLIEAAIVLIIVSILAAMAAPAFRETIEGQRAKAAATDLYVALAHTRSEAIKRNATVGLSPKAGGWANGWQMLDPNNTLILDHEALRNLTVAGPDSVLYMSSGRLQGATAPTIQVSGSYPSSTRCVSADLSGRPYIKTGSC